jgi:uncharacterized protein
MYKLYDDISMIGRTAESTLARYAKGFPVICITGPRQSGKTTLAKMAFPGKPYLSLEDPDIALLARKDPRGLLDQYPSGLILDEAQVVPEIFTWIKSAVDAHPHPGAYVITGSRQFHLLEKITESLAGRAAFLNLLPFSLSELAHAGRKPADPFKTMVKGLYPPVHDRDVTPYDWYGNYISSYIERDVRSIVNVKDISVFQVFVRLCAARSGSILNLSDVARDCGINHNTAKAWISVLETSGVVFLLRPYHRNYGKRLIKSPKLYFIDTGLACRLLGIRDAERLFLSPSRGAIFESFIVAEFLKRRLNAGLSPDMYYWRDNNGIEVDLLLERGEGVDAVEIKSSKTFSEDFVTSLCKWASLSGFPLKTCSVVYAGSKSIKFREVDVTAWNDIS